MHYHTVSKCVICVGTCGQLNMLPVSRFALMVDLLAGPLIGEVCSFEAGEQDNADGSAATGGELILALDPARFGGDDAIDHGERLFARMLAQEGVRLPGDRRLIARSETPESGIEVPMVLHEKIEELRVG